MCLVTLSKTPAFASHSCSTGGRWLVSTKFRPQFPSNADFEAWENDWEISNPIEAGSSMSHSRLCAWLGPAAGPLLQACKFRLLFPRHVTL